MTAIPLLGACSLLILMKGRRILVEEMDEAIYLLEEEWPVKSGAHYWRAVRSCHLARLRDGRAAVAYENMIAACLEAGVRHEVVRSFPDDQTTE